MYLLRAHSYPNSKRAGFVCSTAVLNCHSVEQAQRTKSSTTKFMYHKTPYLKVRQSDRCPFTYYLG